MKDRKDHDATESESERPTQAASARDGAQDRMIAGGGGDHEAYASQLRSQPGGFAQGVAALHAQFGNAYAMQVMAQLEQGGSEQTADKGGHETHHGPLGAGPSIADFEKDVAVLRNRYDARMRALSDHEEEVQNNPGVVPGDPGVEHRLNDPIVSGNRLLVDTKKEIGALEAAKSHEKAGSSRWNQLNNLQQELVRSGDILWEQEHRYRALLKKRGFKAQNVEPFP